ncbi:aryl-alcohol oxidase-like protein [Fomes fomentarius]|nr:aryl-alcohol oxidase-like protein [Fomes fomentarius]
MFLPHNACILLGCSLQLGGVLGALLTDPSHLVGNRSYDFIVVGGGTAASVIAHRLTEHAATTVLLIEAGTSNTDSPDISQIQVPYFVSTIDTSFDWNYTTTPQHALKNRTISYPRGHVLGGSSSTNYMFYTRGSADEFNKLARVSGDHEWSWVHMLRYIKKSEKLSPPADRHNMRGQLDPSVHGTTGPLLTSLPGNASVLDSRVLKATRELAEFPFNLDMNSGNPLGIGWLQSTIGNGARSSAATAFLAPEYLTRHNLDVLIGTRVTRLFPTAKSKNAPVFLGVELAQSPSGKQIRIAAKKEVILSAGSIGTPQLLMLSGIGDRAELKSHEINVIVDLPDVGKNLQDHPWVPLQWHVNTNDTLDNLVRDPAALNAAIALYNRTRQGVLANNPGANHIGWFRLSDESPILKYGDPAAGPLSPHYELTFGNSFLSFTQPLPETGNFMSICAALVAPTSRGSVKISSSSAFNPPLIDPGFMQTLSDLEILTEAVKAAHRFVAAPSWSNFVIAPFAEGAELKTDADIHEYIRNLATTFRHPIGTARMSAEDDKFGVVNPDLRVKNTRGLRVVDASIFPHVFGAHIQGPVYAIAERASDIIKLSHGIPVVLSE